MIRRRKSAPAFIEWPGAGNELQLFETYLIGTPLKALSGVYLFCRPHPSGQWEALFVGETDDLHSSLNIYLTAHVALSPSVRRGATHVSVRLTGSATDRRAREDLACALIKVLRPPLNRPAEWSKGAAVTH